jgi:hypothetical protein
MLLLAGQTKLLWVGLTSDRKGSTDGVVLFFAEKKSLLSSRALQTETGGGAAGYCLDEEGDLQEMIAQ